MNTDEPVFKMICLNCEHRFVHRGWDRTVKCPECNSMSCASLFTHIESMEYESSIKEVNVLFGSV